MAKFFTGHFTPRLDDKGRLILPARFRVLLTEDVMVSPGPDHCLNVWSMDGFESMTSELQRKSQSDQKTRDHIRFLFGHSSEERPDKQGRITLTPRMRQYAGIDRDVVVTGVMDHMEIWDPQAWADRQSGAEDEYANLDGPFGFLEP